MLSETAPPRPRVVMLVDSKIRDLPVAALAAHHMDSLGVECILEPIEAYRAVLAAHRPDLIIFNHLTASHLARFSRRLSRMGVLTAVLLNEGIHYDPEDRKFNSGLHHPDAHIDLYFCWNEPHKAALLAQRADRSTRVEVVGVPRFDYYFEPWSRLYRTQVAAAPRKPRILVCTNFQLAKFAELPPEHGDKLFAQWKDRIPLYRDYRRAFEAQHAARRRIFDYLEPLVRSGEFEVTVRPHPRESPDVYWQWHAQLPTVVQAQVCIDPNSAITTLILGCDLEVSCETCTTALESWIAGKPTIELLFTRHPLLYFPEQAAHETPCDHPDVFVPLIRKVLAEGVSENLQAARQLHLAKWCNGPDGKACLRLALSVAEAIRAKPPADWTELAFDDRRRGLKLQLLRAFGLPYNYDPLMSLKMRLNPGRYAIKANDIRKAITPTDVREMRRQLKSVHPPGLSAG